ncbi:hypothetical protein JN531_004500 [Flagellatimonas centrodinii]|uniref:hypothetical protein n=1 Tax=Flagellatimonas centrodinii TaxID=2806210 RepID=UPI001FEDDD3D|nr:hypothetical protein [Flagellatimonas centrodinii]ULQ47548.1 hypothetical protein JN531_004500 [Flagellatimonas centrodinii]
MSTPIAGAEPALKRLSGRLHRVVDQTVEATALLATHEVDALRGHWSELRERVILARHARTPGQLIREQLDLLPESRNRLRHDHRVRRSLWLGVRQDLRNVQP